MKSLKRWQLPLVMGVVLGALALWTGAAPAVGNGDSVLGGHESRWYVWGIGENNWIGCSADMDCAAHCVGTEWHYCWGAAVSSHSLNCTGGAIVIAEPQEAGGGQGGGIYPAGCDGSGFCPNIYHAYCDY